jgi:hypothetical protein
MLALSMSFVTKVIEERHNKKKLERLVEHFDSKFTAAEIDELIKEFRTPALEYVKDIADYVIKNYHHESIEFLAILYNLFSDPEVKKIKENITEGRDSMEGIVFAKNGKYDVGKTLSFYNLAKLFYDSNIKKKVSPEEKESFDRNMSQVEDSTVYHYFIRTRLEGIKEGSEAGSKENSV